MTTDQDVQVLKAWLRFEAVGPGPLVDSGFHPERWGNALRAIMDEAADDMKVVIGERVLLAIQAHLFNPDHWSCGLLPAMDLDVLSKSLALFDEQPEGQSMHSFVGPGVRGYILVGDEARYGYLKYAINHDWRDQIRVIATTPDLQAGPIANLFLEALAERRSALSSLLEDSGIRRPAQMHAVISGITDPEFSLFPSEGIVSAIAQGSVAELAGFARQIEDALIAGWPSQSRLILCEDQAREEHARLKNLVAMRTTVAGPTWASP